MTQLFIDTVRARDANSVRIMLQYIDPSYENHLALRIASENNDQRTIHALLLDPRSDPTVDQYVVYRNALKNGNEDLVKLLLRDPRIILDDIILDSDYEYDEYTDDDNDYNCTCGHGDYDCDCDSDDCECGGEYIPFS